MKKNIKFAIVGCGTISKKHIYAINQIKNAELAAVCDINESSAKKAGKENNVPYFTDVNEMAEKCAFDVFSILTASGDHSRSVLDLVKHKKHFVVEKPIALRIEDADKMIEACDKIGVDIYVAQQNRFNVPVMKLKEAIDKGRFGKFILGTVRVRWSRTQEYYDEKPWRGTWAHDGGVLTNQASHHIDMLSWMMGDVESVMAMTEKRLFNIEAEDTGVVILKFKNGALGIIEATTATRPRDIEGSISILGENGTVELGGFYMNELKIWEFTEKEPSDDNIFEKYGKNIETYAWNHTEFLKNVVDSIQNNRKGLIDGLEGRKSLELINAIYESAETSRRVNLRFKSDKCRLGIKSR